MHFCSTSIRKSGFSLFELLAVVSIIGILGTLSIQIVSNVRGGAKSAKLDSDLGVLNSATKAYLASSGDLSSAKTPADVLQKLKSQASSSSSAVFNGFRGSFLDTRIEFVLQSAEEGESTDRRLLWDSSALQFTLKRNGGPGIKEVRLNDDLAESPVMYEGRQGVMDLAKKDGWIWDFTEAAPEAKLGTTPVVFTPAVSTLPALPPAITPPPALSALAPPLYSIPSGDYAIEDYPMSLNLTNPNPTGASDIYYRVDYGGWNQYGGGSIPLSPSTRVEAQAYPRDLSAYSASAVKRELYETIPILLDPPVIIPDAESFGLFSKTSINVSIGDTNVPGRAVIDFRVNSGPWTTYVGSFILDPTLFPDGATIEARAVPLSSPYYLPSSTSLKFLSVGSFDLVGTTVGEFSNPVGTSQLVSNLTDGSSSSYFEWGDGSAPGLSESWLDFEGSPFGNIIDGEQFTIGSLEYYNGAILAGTGAISVDFDVALSIDINGETFNPYFDFGFELINNPNGPDPIASADFVFLDDARSSRTLVFNDYEFEFKIEFGDSTSQGFTFVDQFHVLEDKKATTDLFGTFTLIGAVPGTAAATAAAAGGQQSRQGGLVISDDIGTGSLADPLYQKLGYQDPEQFSESLLEDAKQARDEAENASKAALQEEKNAADQHAIFDNEIRDRNYYKAELAVYAVRSYAARANTAANAAEAASTTLLAYLDQAKQIASIEPETEDEAIKIKQLAVEAIAFAEEARRAADEAQVCADEVNPVWAEVLANARNSENRAVDFLRYLADKAAYEAGRAKSLSGTVQSSYNSLVSDAENFAKKISEGKYAEAELLFESASSLSSRGNNYATWTESAAIQARDYVIQAGSINPDNYNEDEEVAPAAASLSDVKSSAITAETYSAEASGFAAQATTLSNQVESDWNQILSSGATDFPVEFATYLQDKAKRAKDAAKSAQDTAKSAWDQAKRNSEEAIKKAGEGKYSEAQEKADLTDYYATTAESAAPQAETLAFEARALAVQAGVIASSNSAASSVSQNANVYASEAEDFAATARTYADEASAFRANAYAALP